MSFQFNKMWKPLWLAIVLTAAMFEANRAEAFVAAKPEELQRRNVWLKERFIDAKPQLPFSFLYDGKKSEELLVVWPKKATTTKLDAVRTQHTFTWTDSKNGLEVRCVAVEYADFPVAEWTVYFKNTGDKNTPILKDIQGLDAAFHRGDGGEFVLHGNKGDSNKPNSYEPFQLTLGPRATQNFVPVGGWGTCGAYPYYNLQMPGGGAIVVIGWPGQWASSFVRDEKNGLRIKAGQELTSLTLKPGEEIRSPLVVLMFWQGADKPRSQNLWRRWMIAHNLPRTADGKLAPTQLCGNVQGFMGFTTVTEENQKEYIDLYLKRGLSVDYWWIDAGWFTCNGDWWHSGTWEADKKRFPKGLKPVSDYAHSKGLKLVIWFEPERIGDVNSWLGKNHPEWLTPGVWGSTTSPKRAREWSKCSGVRTARSRPRLSAFSGSIPPRATSSRTSTPTFRPNPRART